MKFRKKPVIIEAIQFNNNQREIEEFTLGESFYTTGGDLMIKTLEGVLKASELDWIIKGVSGEFYPCKPDIFEKTYDAME